PDVFLLSRLISAAQDDDDRLVGLLVIDAVARTMMNAHFAYAFAHRLDVAGVTKAQPRYARSDFSLGSFIREVRKPSIELIRREQVVSYRIQGHSVKRSNLVNKKAPAKPGPLISR